jgi:TatD DNase family protein
MQDIHTHLYWESYDTDREEVLKRAQEAGVETMLVVGTSIEENESAVALANRYQHIFASVGVHPNNFREAVAENWSAVLTEQAQAPEVVAIGECGLDYSESHGSITDEQKENQKQGFIQQLQLASKLQLPVIVHCRAKNGEADDAYWDVLSILKEYHSQLKAIVLHCYMGSMEVTHKFLELENVYFSFTGNITYPVKKSVEGGNFDLTKVAQHLPLERLFTETDCPFLAPQQYRGKRNEPAYVVAVAERIAELHSVSVEAVASATKNNFSEVFLKTE